MLDNLITDRTAADVQKWRSLRDKGINGMTAAERAEWDRGMKGAYNYTDLNRVCNALNFVRDRLIDAGYLLGNEFILKTDWDGSDVPTTADFSMYIKAVNVIRGAIARSNQTPQQIIDIGSIDYQMANDIEKIIVDTDYRINNMQANPKYCGELYSGEI